MQITHQLVYIVYIAGVLYDKTGSYTPPFVVSGVGMAAGGVLLFLMPCCPR